MICEYFGIECENASAVNADDPYDKTMECIAMFDGQCPESVSSDPDNDFIPVGGIVMPASIFLDRFTNFLGNSDGQTTEEVKAELREQGIDIDSFLSEAKAKIKGYIRRHRDM